MSETTACNIKPGQILQLHVPENHPAVYFLVKEIGPEPDYVSLIWVRGATDETDLSNSSPYTIVINTRGNLRFVFEGCLTVSIPCESLTPAIGKSIFIVDSISDEELVKLNEKLQNKPCPPVLDDDDSDDEEIQSFFLLFSMLCA